MDWIIFFVILGYLKMLNTWHALDSIQPNPGADKQTQHNDTSAMARIEPAPPGSLGPSTRH